MSYNLESYNHTGSCLCFEFMSDVISEVMVFKVCMWR